MKKNKFMKLSMFTFINLCQISAFAGPNLITNPGFESGLASWTNLGNSALSSSANGGISSVQTGTAAGGISQTITNVVPGRTYNFSAFARIETMAVSSLVGLRIKNSTGGLVGEYYLPIGTTSFKVYSQSFVMPANAASVEVFTLKEAGALSYLTVDDFSLADNTVINTAPTLTATSVFSGSEDGVINFSLPNGVDAENNPLTYSLASSVVNGTLVCNSQVCSYAPNANFNGADTFTFKANDGALDSNIASATINVLPVNDAPVLNTSLSISTNQDTAKSFSLTAASDIDSASLTYKIATSPVSGTVSCTGLSCSYTPKAGFYGTDSFTYVANDGVADSDAATVSVKVVQVLAPVNLVQNTSFESTLSPWKSRGSSTRVKTTAYAGSYSVRTGTGAGGIYQTISKGIVPGQKYTLSGYAKIGTMAVSSLIGIKLYNSAGGMIDAYNMPIATTTFTKYEKSFVMPAGVTRVEVYTQKDAGALSYLYVDELYLKTEQAVVNTLPVLAITQSVSAVEDTVASFTLNSATDAENNALSYSLVTNPASGTLSCNMTTRACTYTPVANASGLVSFTYKANDGALDSSVSTVSISVAPVNDAPVIGSATSVSTNQDTSATFNLTSATDLDSSALTYVKVTDPSHGKVTCTSGGSTVCTYVPTAGYYGTDAFTYKANDGLLDSNIASVSIAVAQVIVSTTPPQSSQTTPPQQSTGSPAATLPSTTSGYLPLGVGGGGAMSGVSISPFNNLWFVGTDMGTLFKSTDYGKSWRPVNHFQAIFSNDLFKAVSVGFSADGVTVFHAAAGANPKRSTDAGETFTSMKMSLGTGELIKYWYADIANANIMYAGTTAGLLKTSDKGATWTRLSGTTEESIGTFIDQFSATKRIYHATKTKILSSDNGGTSFTQYYAPTGISIRQFAGAVDTRGLTLAFGDNNGAGACSWAAQYASSWGQSSVDAVYNNCGYLWVNKYNAGFTRTTQEVGNHVKMADNDSDTIYVTGGKEWLKQYGTKVYVSHDAGSTFTLKLFQNNWDVNPYQPWAMDKIEYSAVALDVGWWDSGYESFGINQLDSNVVSGTGWFFIHTSKNAGDFWESSMSEYADTGTAAAKKNWKTRGLEVISAYKMKFHPNNTNLLYVASADIGGIVSEDHGNSFRVAKAEYNSNYDYAFDVNNDQIVYAASGALHDFPNEWHANSYAGEGGIYKSINRGRNWTRITPNNTTFNRQFISVGYDSARKIVYGGTQEVGIARSLDNGVTWAYFNTGLPSGVNIIPQIEVDPTNGNVYALVTGDAPNFNNQASTGVYFLDVKNGATSWTLLRGTVNYPAEANAGYKVWYYPTSFAVDWTSLDGNKVIYLTDYENHGNWLMTGVWKTTDNGKNWTRMKQITHAVNVSIDPSDSNKIYVSGYYDLSGTWGNGGQYSSRDGGLNWSKNLDLPLQANARSALVDPTDPTRIFYSFFGGGILYGENPNK